MNEVGTIIAILVIAALVGADILVRLVIAPHRRDRFLEELMDNLVETVPSVGEDISQPTAVDERIGENLLRHFEQSAMSRRVLTALASRSEAMRERDVEAVVNHELVRSHKRPLPASVLRRIVMILMGANLVALRRGKLEITDSGKLLGSVLRARSANKAWSVSAFISPRS